MTHWAKVGAKCVCVCDEWMTDVHPDSINTPSPTLGEVVIINEVVVRRSGAIMVGIDGFDTDYFSIHCFRPLITRTQEQDVELFAPLLDTANHEDLERAL